MDFEYWVVGFGQPHFARVGVERRPILGVAPYVGCTVTWSSNGPLQLRAEKLVYRSYHSPPRMASDALSMRCVQARLGLRPRPAQCSRQFPHLGRSEGFHWSD